MQKIIVPTDFSYASKDAYLFAYELAKELAKDIEVIHAYSGSFDTGEPFVVKAGKGRHDALVEDLRFFSKLEDSEVKEDQSVKITHKAIHGSTEKALIKISQEPDTYLLMMGTTGRSISRGRLFGSTSIDVSQKSACPVMLIPKGVKYQSVTDVLYAIDEESLESEQVKQAIDFAGEFGAKVHFIHIHEKGSDPDSEELETELFNQLFADGDPPFEFNLATVPADTVVGGLNQYVEENSIELVIMVTEHRSFWENLFHDSMTKRMALTTEVPILIYHKKED